MADDRAKHLAPDDVADEDNRAEAAAEAEVEQDDNWVNEEAADDAVTIPASAAIDQPDAVPPDGGE